MNDPLPRMVRVTPRRKCPVCGKPDYCLVCPSGKSAICQRVESRRKCGEAGWLHRLEEPIPAFVPKPERKKDHGDWFARAKAYSDALSKSKREELAANLGLPPNGLDLLYPLGIVDGCFTFPERDGKGKIIGLNRRFPDGRKLHIPGGGRGLSLPNNWMDASRRTLYVVEGPTDTMAMVSAGMNAIGRPSNRGGVGFLSEIIPALIDRDVEIVIVGENDKRWNEEFKRWDWPGLVGCLAVAGELSKAIRNPVHWTLPPTDYKDVREFLTNEQFEAVQWYDRGRYLAAEFQMYPATHCQDGYSQFAAEAGKQIGYDESQWRY